MQELRFIATDGGALIVSDESGEQYRVVVDDALRDALRPRPHVRSDAPKVTPREIQQLIRAGRTVDEVVEMTGADRDDVDRFEGPIKAERGHIVDQSRLVKVRVQPDADPLDPDATSFGAVIDERLDALGAASVLWDAWKDPEEGWRVGLEFSVDGIDRDATWSYDPRARSLVPRNPAAITLSQQGEMSALQAPRLRAVEPEHLAGDPDLEQRAEQDAPRETEVPPRASDPKGAAWLGAAVADIGQQRDGAPRDETADLLEQLRRRRGERAHQPFDEVDDDGDADDLELDGHEGDETSDNESGAVTPFSRARDRSVAAHPSMSGEHERITPASSADADDADDLGDLSAFGTRRRDRRDAERHDDLDASEDPDDDSAPSSSERRGGVHAVDVPLAGLETPAPASLAGDRSPATASTSQRGATGPVGRKRGRASLPSWDEIVFGTRSDDDRD